MTINGAKKKGFTLIELLIVVAIIAAATAILIPRIGNQDAKLYKVQLRTLINTLNYNRRNAVVLNRPYKMTIYPYIDDIEKENDRERIKGNWYSKGAGISWQEGTNITRNKPVSLTFFPQGGATGGMIILQQGRFIANINIDGITGKSDIVETSSETNE